MNRLATRMLAGAALTAVALSGSALAQQADGSDPAANDALDTAPATTRGLSTTAGAPASSAVEVQDIELYASDDAAQLSIIAASSRFDAESARLRFGFLYGEDRDNVFSVGGILNTSSGLIPGVTLAVGARAYAGLLALEDTDVFGIAPGIEAAYNYPTERFPLHLGVGVYYAPDVLTFGQADRIIDYYARVGLRLRESLMGFVGFRFLEFDTQPGDREIDDQLHVGIRWTAQ